MLALANDPTIAFADRADRTIRGEEFGTVILKSVNDPVPLEARPEDPIARLEAKLDAALRAIAAMQQRIESLDATLMRVLMR